MGSRRRTGAGAALLRAENGALAPGSARSLLLTVLGELVRPTGTPVWTSALVHVLEGLGVAEQTVRQAIARAASSGWIHPERHGREVAWTLSEDLVRIIDAGADRVYSLSDPFSDWDGSWLALVPTIPQAQRKARRPLYAGLTWAGFGNPAPGLWVSPHAERSAEVHRLVTDLGLEEHTFSFRGSLAGIGMTQRDVVRRGWDLEGLEAHYQRLLDAVSGLDPVDEDATLLAHVRMISEWQEMPRTDPQLPELLLPDWIGRDVARRIEALRARWTPVVRDRFAVLNSNP